METFGCWILDMTTSLLTDFSEPVAACHIGTGGTLAYVSPMKFKQDWLAAQA